MDSCCQSVELAGRCSSRDCLAGFSYDFYVGSLENHFCLFIVFVLEKTSLSVLLREDFVSLSSTTD